MKKYLYILTGCIMAVGIFCCGCGEVLGNRKQNIPIQSIDTAMGTIVNQTLYGEDAEETAEEILQLITKLEQERLSWRVDTSEVYAMNANAGRQTGIPLSKEMNGILEKCLQVSGASEGAFDITIGRVVRLWDIDSWAGVEDVEEYKLPDEKEIRQALENTGYEKLVLQDNTLYLPEYVQLDLGAVGKGIALDEIGQKLAGEENIAAGVISVGGSILTYGIKPDQSPWRVGVVNPGDSAGNLGYLELTGQWCVSTSGDYERYVEVDGVRYHHIINPATGQPADSGVRGVTILSKDGLLSDALSTACFILGAEEGSRLAESFGAEALFVDYEGNIVMTEGMEQYFHLSK